MLLIPRLIPRSIVLAIALLAGAGQAEVRVAGGADRWSQVVQKDWAPRSEAAQAASGWAGMMMKVKRGNRQMAGLMSMYLQAITGERFLDARVA